MAAKPSFDLATWRQRIQQMQIDAEFVAQRRDGKNQRNIALPEMNTVLKNFLTGKLTLAAFRETFQKKTQKEWRDFGLNGFSGAMVLNMLVKNIPNQIVLHQQLLKALTAPKSSGSGQQQMKAFVHYLKALIDSGEVAKTQINLGFIPYFLSAFWHVQKKDEYPIFYPTSRTALVTDSLYVPPSDDVEHYFLFQEVFTKLARELRLSLWDLEDVCIWQVQHGTIKPKNAVQPKLATLPPIAATSENREQVVEESMGRIHTQAQYVLADIGRSFGYKVWIAANDHKGVWDKNRLGDLSIEKLPTFGFDNKTQRVVELIDVLWLKGRNQIVAAFEVEHSTSIYSGLLRMSDLVLLAPNLAFNLYIVTSKKRLPEVRVQLQRPTFQEINLNGMCGIFDYETLFENADSIKKFGNDVHALSNITEYVPDNLDD